MEKIHYPNTIRSHLVTIVPIAQFTPKSTSKLKSTLQIYSLYYSIVIQRFISCSIIITIITTGFLTLLTTTTMFIVAI